MDTGASETSVPVDGSYSSKVRPESSSSMKPHVNHEGAVTVPKVHTLVLLVLAGAQLELLLYVAVSSRNLPELKQPEVSRTHLSLLLW
jgi:hypothetical protein